MPNKKNISISGHIHHFQPGMKVEINGAMHKIHEMLYGVTHSNIKRDTRVLKFVKKFKDEEYALEVVSDLLFMAHKVGLLNETQTDWQNHIILGDPIDFRGISVHPVKDDLDRRRKAKRKKQDSRDNKEDVVAPGFRARKGQRTQSSSNFHGEVFGAAGSKRKRDKFGHSTFYGRNKVRSR